MSEENSNSVGVASLPAVERHPTAPNTVSHLTSPSQTSASATALSSPSTAPVVTETAGATAAGRTIQSPPASTEGSSRAVGTLPLAQHDPSPSLSVVDSRLTSFMPTPRHGVAAAGHGPLTSELPTFIAGAPSTLLGFKSIPPTPKVNSAQRESAAEAGGDDTDDKGTAAAAGSPNIDSTTKRGDFPRYADEMDEDVDGDRPPPSESRRVLQDSIGLEYVSFAGPLDVSLQMHGAGGEPSGSLLSGIFNIFKGNVGAGVFLLPTYYTDAGYALGFVVVSFMGIMMVDCCLTLLAAKHNINRVDVQTYPAVVDFVLGKWFKRFTMFSLIFTQFGFCIMFLQYSASMFGPLFDIPFMYELFIVIGVAVVTPFTFLSHRMEYLAYVSLFAGVCVVVVLAGTTMVDFAHLSSNGVATGVVAAYPSFRIFTFLSGHMFSLEGIGVVLPVENSLAPEAKPKFRGVIKYTLGSIVSFYIFFGILGYMAYGDSLKTSVVLALPPGPIKVVLQILMGVSLLLGYPIQFVPAIQLVDKAMHISMQTDRPKALTVRLVLNIIFGVSALFIGAETLNIFASFLGAFAGVHLMLTIPALLGLQAQHALSETRDSLTYKEYIMQLFKGPHTVLRSRFYVYLALALLIWVIGIYFTILSVF